MSELDVERIEEFGFEELQSHELLSHYQKAVANDFHEMQVLWDEKNIQQLLLKLHAYKGMIGLFAKASMVDFIVKLEQDLQHDQFHSVALVEEAFQTLSGKCQNLIAEVSIYLEGIA